MSSRHSTTDFSKKLADKLLQGWAMLDIQCPNTECPGASDKHAIISYKQQLYCVACQTFYMEENNMIKPITLYQTEGQMSAGGSSPLGRHSHSSTLASSPSSPPRTTFHDLTAKLSEDLDGPVEKIYLSTLRSLFRQVAVHNHEIATAREVDDLRRSLSSLESSLKSIQIIKKLMV